ncbi:ABC transporter ATP-binding protein (plasmid) [Paroceanicella profunda]|uniref:ABC transporter ATP-binding protein n=1 Tax=Paroceanicella profunda TaxID=2579971 RepID=A0A5B8FZY0_9RHOB|nr:ABC transporter ATP-binding protein [Paroceanicella profunda]QDL94035.1 ABC transporter ATP-binding protein [Paroceanicella profunda]
MSGPVHQLPAPVFELLDVEKVYQVTRPAGFLRREKKGLAALDGVRLRVAPGSSTALVGESGSGKSTLLRVLLGLTRPTNGQAFYRGRPIAEARAASGDGFTRDVAMIYQDARGSLNPRMAVAELVAEPLRHFGLCAAAEIPARVAALLARVGLPGDVAARYPAALSGGQVRRVAIARALAAEPSVLVADEAVSGLDVSTQAQLLNLLAELKESMGLTLLFITHDLGVASYLCERIAIMYLGRIVEAGPTNAVLAAPAHPYTAALRAASPQFFAPIAEPLPGEIPSPVDLPPGCRFASRCPRAAADCRVDDPALTTLSPGRAAACLHPLATGA